MKAGKSLSQNVVMKSHGALYINSKHKLKIEKVISTLRRGEHMTKTIEETAQCLLDIHIPNDLSHEDMQEQGVIRNLAPDTDAQSFTGKEMTLMVKTFKNDKVEQFLRVFNVPSVGSFLQSGRKAHYVSF